MQIPEDLYSDRQDERRKSAVRKLPFHWRQRWRQWIDRRLPPANSVTLNHRNIFIFPTKAGLGFLVCLLMLLLIAINFENSAVYALTFLLGGILAVSILHTFSNLLGLKLSCVRTEHAFSGRNAIFEIMLVSKGRLHLGVQLSWQQVFSERVDVRRREEKRLALRYQTGPRGYCNPGRFKLESSYPLGLIRAWTWVDLNVHTLVYPCPDERAGDPHSHLVNHDSGSKEIMGSDDFYGLRSYTYGDSLRTVAWKNFAKTDVLSSKQFVDYTDERLWLDWDATQGSIEDRLSQLCHWALIAEAGHNEYGLRLPGGVNLPPSHGRSHLHEVLVELAIYNQTPPESSLSSGAIKSQDEHDVALVGDKNASSTVTTVSE